MLQNPFFRLNGIKHYALLYPNIKREGNVKAQWEFITDAVNVNITRHFDKHKFHKLVAVMRSDPAFKSFTDGEVYNYLGCIKIESAELVNEDAVDYDILMMNSPTLNIT